MFDYPQQPPQHYEHVVKLDIPLAAIIRIPTGEQKDLSYKNLICSEEDKALIFELITTLSDNSKFSLLMKQSHLRQIGIQISHVHPFKFLAAIFSNSRLKACMNNIFDDYFKRNGFMNGHGMDGLASSLTREASKGKLAQYLKDFAQEINVSESSLLALFNNKEWSGSDWDSRDWEKLVRFLMES